jgi:isochorismate hydrolase
MGDTTPEEDLMSQVNTPQNSVMINPDDAVMLLIDHQSDLFNVVTDIPVPDLRRNVIALATVATLLKIPVITTASVPDGPNGPLIPEIHQAAPHAQYVARQGQVNAWDMPTFVQAIEATGRRTLIMAGTLTCVCLAFPAVCAVAARVQGVWRRGRLGQLEQDGDRSDHRPHHTGRRDSDRYASSDCGTTEDLEPSGCTGVR